MGRPDFFPFFFWGGVGGGVAEENLFDDTFLFKNYQNVEGSDFQSILESSRSVNLSPIKPKTSVQQFRANSIEVGVWRRLR